MPRHIIGQCNQANFASIEHLAEMTKNPEMIDVTTLTNNQRYAFRFLQIAMRKGITWILIRQVVKEVLFWGEGSIIKAIEIKFIPEKPGITEFKKLWG